VVALLMTVGVLLQQETGPAEEQKASGFAVLAGQAEAVLEKGVALADGALLPAGPLHLASGVAQIELFSGVTVIVEGAAEFEIISAMEMRVTQGKVRARVPEPAHGFRIHTTAGEVVDLGTEFAMNVSGVQSEVHVLDGEVEWHPRSEVMQKIEKGAALGCERTECAVPSGRDWLRRHGRNARKNGGNSRETPRRMAACFGHAAA